MLCCHARAYLGPILTDSDRAHLAMTRKSKVGFGTRPALLMIDL
jgi:hypothetical protein